VAALRLDSERFRSYPKDWLAALQCVTAAENPGYGPAGGAGMAHRTKSSHSTTYGAIRQPTQPVIAAYRSLAALSQPHQRAAEPSCSTRSGAISYRCSTARRQAYSQTTRGWNRCHSLDTLNLLAGFVHQDEETMLEVLLDWRGNDAVNEARLAAGGPDGDD
jgi:hypothetical protein